MGKSKPSTRKAGPFTSYVPKLSKRASKMSMSAQAQLIVAQLIDHSLTKLLEATRDVHSYQRNDDYAAYRSPSGTLSVKTIAAATRCVVPGRLTKSAMEAGANAVGRLESSKVS